MRRKFFVLTDGVSASERRKQLSLRKWWRSCTGNHSVTTITIIRERRSVTSSELYSFVLALLTALAAGLVGSFALMKRMSLAGDVISHVALPGLGLALLFRINPVTGAAAALLIGTLLIWHLQKSGTLTTDVAIGVIFTAALAIGTLVTPSEDLIEALFGGFQSLTLGGFILGMLLVAAILLFIYI